MQFNYGSRRVCLAAKHKLLLLYMSDMPAQSLHHNVVDKLRIFIETHGDFVVAMFDASECLKIDEVLAESQSAHYIIIVHSESANRPRRGSYIGDWYPTGTFDKTLELLQKREEQSTANKLIHVSFHYSSPDCVVGVKLGLKFRLVLDLSELMKALNGGSVNECSGCTEGPALMKAFTKAGGHEAMLFESSIIPPDFDENDNDDIESVGGFSAYFLGLSQPSNDLVKCHKPACLYISSV